MCARTPATCPECGNNLHYKAGQRTECTNRHTAPITAIPLTADHDLVSQYHASGRSHVMVRTLCNNCRPL